MTDRAALVASLPTGPREPVEGTPSRRPGSVRRTTSVDEAWADFGRPRRLRAAGRDLLTLPDGTTLVHDEAELSITLDGSGTVAEIDAEPAEPRLRDLRGAPVRSGFRAAAANVLSDHAARRSVLFQLLDDVPLAAVISGYGLTRENPEWNIPPEAADRLRDLCSGWADGATMIGALDRTGVFPIPEGPPAPSLLPDDDPFAWHDTDPMERRTVRRVRRLDLWRDGPDVALEVYFRDSHLGSEGPEDVLHEYTLSAVLTPTDDGTGELRVERADVVAHTLPWPECPAATASVRRVVGLRVRELAEVVRTGFTGTSTCTHLNDVLRSAGAAADLAELLP
ncbi:MAG: DUF2889 domain-containing protein [Microthrixaceae bacterium]